MKRKIVLLLVSCLMAVSLILASCAPAVVEEEEKPPVVEEKKPVVEEKKPVVEEKPQYGGTLVMALNADTKGFDEAYGSGWCAYTLHLTNEHLLQGDWAKGLAGTGDTSWWYEGWHPEYTTGALAESWEFPDANTLIIHVRQGVHWHNKPPVNGREMTAEDVAYSFNRIFTSPTCWQYSRREWFKGAEVTAPWTVTVKLQETELIRTLKMMSVFAPYLRIVPREMVEKYGDMTDWRNSCGTGAFLLVDYVPGASTTFDRNPNYWQHDPLHPENQLPYVDHVRWQILTDVSTRLAAMRTGKVDWVDEVGWEDGAALLSQHPKLEQISFLLTTFPVLHMRTDTKPFDDIRVRRALHMAIDLQSINDVYYGGNAVMLSYQVPPRLAYSGGYTPIEELPESTRELFTYNPEEAKRLLAEAGYPDGFKTNIICEQKNVDLISFAAGYWADIGVDLELQIKEFAVFRSIEHTHSHDQIMAADVYTGVPYQFNAVNPMSYENLSIIDDPYVNETRAEIAAWEHRDNKALQDKLAKELNLYILDKSWVITMPCPYLYRIWWPWLENYHGEITLGVYDNYNFAIWASINQNMKKAMGY